MALQFIVALHLAHALHEPRVLQVHNPFVSALEVLKNVVVLEQSICVFLILLRLGRVQGKVVLEIV